MQVGDYIYRVEKYFDTIVLRKLQLIRRDGKNVWLAKYEMKHPYSIYCCSDDYSKSAAEAVEKMRCEMTVNYHENMRTLDALSAEEIND